MGFLDFLKKKQASTSAKQTASSSSPVAPTSQAPNMPTSSIMDLPELPSFDSSMSGNLSHDLPPLPSFDDHTQMNAPADFSLPQMPSFDNEKSQAASFSSSVNANKQSQSSAMMPPPLMMSAASAPAQSHSDSHDDSMPSVDARTPYGPVFCDVETYRAILTNMSYAKDEVMQLQSFSDNGAKLQQKSQVQYDNFHNTLSSMAKKLLLAEAKLFK